MQLDEFFDYKNQLMKDLLTSDSIVELLSDGKEPLNEAEAIDLRYTQIFPCEYVPDTTSEGCTYICFDVDIQRTSSKTYYSPVLYIWVFTHKSLLRLPNGGGVRVDRLCSEICKKINGSRYYGLGQLELASIRRFAPITDYIGKVMAFHASDFNRVYNPKQPIPSNRKSD